MIKYHLGKRSEVLWAPPENNNIKLTTNSFFTTSDGFSPQEIRIGKKELNWKVSLCHEIAHLYLSKKMIGRRYFRNYSEHSCHYTFKLELLVWRITKTFCKKRYWDENWAKECLKSYQLVYYPCERDIGLITIDWEKLKIVPLHLT